MIDWRMTKDPEAWALLELVERAIGAAGVEHLMATAKQLVEPTVTDPMQKLALVSAMREVTRNTLGLPPRAATEAVLRAALVMKWQDVGLAGDDAPALGTEQRLGLLLAIGEAARAVLAEHAAYITGLCAGSVAIKPAWAAEDEPEEDPDAGAE